MGEATCETETELIPLASSCGHEGEGRQHQLNLEGYHVATTSTGLRSPRSVEEGEAERNSATSDCSYSRLSSAAFRLGLGTNVGEVTEDEMARQTSSVMIISRPSAVYSFGAAQLLQAQPQSELRPYFNPSTGDSWPPSVAASGRTTPSPTRSSILRAEDYPMDDWNVPSDQGFQFSWVWGCWSCLELLISLTVIGLGIYCILHYDLHRSDYLSFWYIVGSQLGDVILLLVIGGFIMLLGLCCGRSAREHALSLISILMKTFQALVYYAGFICGVLLLCHYDWEKVPWPLLSCVTSETILSCCYSLATCPTVYGVVGYGLHKIGHRIARLPIVEFHMLRGQHPDPFLNPGSLGVYRDSLARMQNPALTASVVSEVQSQLTSPYKQSVVKTPTRASESHANKEELQGLIGTAANVTVNFTADL